MKHEFLKAWSEFRLRSGPQILRGDELLLRAAIAKRFTVQYSSWSRFLRRHDFGNHDRRLHLSLIPQPFFGDITRASVVVLTLNPGLKPVDYFGEHYVKQYRRALLANLRLRQTDDRFPHIFLNPAFSWHSGFMYWHGHLARLIDTFAAQLNIERIDALSFFSKSIATLELVPYHSISFGLSNRIVSGLRSVDLAKSFVTDVLLPRARASKTLLVVARQAKHWGLCEGKGVVVYDGGETRAAYLTPNSRGGSAILKRLRHVWRKTVQPGR